MTADFRAPRLFFLALWAWMRAHPTCDFEEFTQAIDRILAQVARPGARLNEIQQ